MSYIDLSGQSYLVNIFNISYVELTFLNEFVILSYT